VVTGLGWVGAAGTGRAALGAALASGRPETSAVEESSAYHRRGGARRALLARTDALAEWVPPRAARRMSRPSKLALAAARMAHEDAGAPELPPSRAGIALGTAFGAAAFTEQLLGELFDDPQLASPFRFAESVANAAAGQLAIALGAAGPNWTLAQREASSLQALGEAVRGLVAGRADAVYAGGVEEMTPLLHAALDRFRALARPERGGEEIARPFDARRSGFLAGSGAAILLVEEEERARARGAPLRARILAAIGAFDPTAPAAGWGSGSAALAERLSRGLERTGLGPDDIVAVVSGASGARRGDALEADVLRALWPASPPPIMAPKGVLGEYAGGALAAAVLAVEQGRLESTAGFERADPALGIEPVREATPIPRGPVLVSTLAAGGAAGWLVLEAVS
jgi:3-oxoacyl-[acyl-carrier-protein] synthase II